MDSSIVMSQANGLKKEVDRQLKALSESLAQGNSDKLIDYLGAVAKFHQYSPRNSMLIMYQCIGASHVAGYKTWQTLGRQVNKGSKAIKILAPCMAKEKDDTGTETGRKITFFRIVNVFDISQTEGEPLPEINDYSGNPDKYLDKLTTMIQANNISISNATDLDTGCWGYAKQGSKGKEIHITALENMPVARYFSVLVHEFAHCMLHVGVKDRPGEITRETEAEAVACVVCEALGLGSQLASTDYIHSFKADHKTLACSLTRIQKTANTILTGLEK